MAEKKKPGRKPKAKVEEPVVGVAEVEPKAEQNSELEPKGKTTADSEIEALKSLVKQLQDQLAAQKPHVVQVMADTEKVVLRFQAEVADDNVATFGPEGMYGQVTGKTGTITVPKSEWSRFYNESVRNMIYRRWLIVLSGMDEQERELYGCNYKPGEILDELAFQGFNRRFSCPVRHTQGNGSKSIPDCVDGWRQQSDGQRPDCSPE